MHYLFKIADKNKTNVNEGNKVIKRQAKRTLVCSLDRNSRCN